MSAQNLLKRIPLIAICLAIGWGITEAYNLAKRAQHPTGVWLGHFYMGDERRMHLELPMSDRDTDLLWADATRTEKAVEESQGPGSGTMVGTVEGEEKVCLFALPSKFGNEAVTLRPESVKILAEAMQRKVQAWAKENVFSLVQAADFGIEPRSGAFENRPAEVRLICQDLQKIPLDCFSFGPNSHEWRLALKCKGGKLLYWSLSLQKPFKEVRNELGPHLRNFLDRSHDAAVTLKAKRDAWAKTGKSFPMSLGGP